VAIKTVRKELIEDDDRAGMALARFRNEARAAGRLSHPGIVAVYDYGESDAVTYIAMEYVQGNSLREYFNRSTRFSEPDVVSIMAQLLEALQHAHEAGVWHRDIKPANLIIMGNGRLKIADFGIARIESSQLTQTGMVMGSPGYMAPEQYAGGAVDFRADLFAAGVVMHQLLTGVRLFTGSAEQVAYRICHQEAPPPSTVEPGKGWERYDPVLACALAKDPSQRYASARAFRDAILDIYAAPANASVSEETIIAAPTMPAAVFEPSNPSARTGDRSLPFAAQRTAPIAAPALQPPEAVAAPAAEPALIATALPGSKRQWPLLLGAMFAVVIGTVIGAWWVQKATAPSPEPIATSKTSVASKTATAATPAQAAPSAVRQPPPARMVAVAPDPAPAPKPARIDIETKRDAARSPVKTEAAAASPPKAPAPRRTEAKPAPPLERKPLGPSPLGQETAPAPPAVVKPPPPKPVPVAASTAAAPPAPVPPETQAKAEPAPPPEPSIWRDQGITMKVASKIQFNRRLWSSGIQVETVAGEVRLTGTVGSRAISDEAERIAAAVPGVLSVKNNLKVSP
jgi:hypothetical protein